MAADVDRWPRFLQRFGEQFKVGKFEACAATGDLVFAPQRADQLQTFAHARAAARGGDAEGLQIAGRVTIGDAEMQTAIAEHVDHGGGLRHAHRMVDR